MKASNMIWCIGSNTTCNVLRSAI